MTPEQEIAELKLQLRNLNIRLDMKNKSDQTVHALRANISQELWLYGLYLDAENKIQKIEK
jgi:hypothetical protein